MLQVVKQGIGHTIWACADNEADDIGDGKCLVVFLKKIGNGVVSVGVSLKVGEIFHGGVLAGEKMFTFFQLLGNGLSSGTVGGVKGLVVAVGTTAHAYRSVAVGTGEAGIDRYFLGFAAVESCEPGAVFVVAGHSGNVRGRWKKLIFMPLFSSVFGCKGKDFTKKVKKNTKIIVGK